VSHPEADFWDRVYAGEAYRFGLEPNAFLASRAGDIAPGGRVLCIGDGEGRNGVWLARRGFAVTSLDQSPVAARKCAELASSLGVGLEVAIGRLPEHPLPESGFDAVVLIFVHLDPEVRRAVHAAAIRALRPGGVVILEAFTPAQLGRPSGGPPTRERLQTAADLAQDFAALERVLLEETETELSEGEGHRGPAAVVRLVALKRA
jgi:SAM-dependent methyltransferase